MKKFFIVLIMILSCASMNAQKDMYRNSSNKGLDGFDTPISKFTGHLVDKKQHFEAGIGAMGGDYNYLFLLHGGYYPLSRIGLYADLGFDRYNIGTMVPTVYVYEAIPSLRGGYYFNIGITAGFNVDAFYKSSYHYWDIIFGPSIIMSHNLFDHVSIAIRGTWNALSASRNSEYSYFNAAAMLVFHF